jgi:hypothetical protein
MVIGRNDIVNGKVTHHAGCGDVEKDRRIFGKVCQVKLLDKEGLGRGTICYR